MQLFTIKKWVINLAFFLSAMIIQIPGYGRTELLLRPQKEIVVTGKVSDENGEPLAGVTVLEKGTGASSTFTDEEGSFSIQVDTSSTIVFRFLGYKTIEMPALQVKQKGSITMIRDNLKLDEVVVTGYGTQKKADLTGAVTVVNVDQLKSSTEGSAMKALKGKVPGMSISENGSPNPGAGVLIRGQGTLNSTAPLYVIDGVPTTDPSGMLTTSDIASIQVLKDASSASIYGARASNGVIIITTKKGRKGTVVDFNASYTLTSNKKPFDLMDTRQRGIIQFWAIKNDNPDADPNEVGIGGLYHYDYHKDANGNFVLDNVTWREYLDPEEKTMKSANTDWMKELLRLGIVQKYNISLSSGRDKSHYFFNLGYYNNKGTVKQGFYKRFSGRFNSDFTLLNGRIKIGENLKISKWRERAGGDLGSAKSVMSIIPVHTVDGIGWGGPIGGMSDRQNPVRVVADNLQNHSDNLRLFGNAYIDIQLIQGLSFRSSFGGDLIGYWNRQMDLTYQSGFLSQDENKVTETASYNFNWNNSNVLHYTFNKGENNFYIMLGQETISQEYNSFWASRKNYALETPAYMQLSKGETDKDNGSNATRNVMFSYFGKINYNYDNRYLASVTLRRDGSSVFGKDNRFGFFPAFSLGWVISEEKFLTDLAPTVSYLKLRYGWGENGNSQIADYAAFGMYQYLYSNNSVWDWNWGTAYDFKGDGGFMPSGFRRIQLASPHLKWESTSQHDIGLDYGFLNSKIHGSFDYYFKFTKDILMKPGYVATKGEGASQWINGASIRNRGFGLSVSYTNTIGNLGVDIGGVFSHNKQEVVYVPEGLLNNFAGNGAFNSGAKCYHPSVKNVTAPEITN